MVCLHHYLSVPLVVSLLLLLVPIVTKTNVREEKSSCHAIVKAVTAAQILMTAVALIQESLMIRTDIQKLKEKKQEAEMTKRAIEDANVITRSRTVGKGKKSRQNEEDRIVLKGVPIVL